MGSSCQSTCTHGMFVSHALPDFIHQEWGHMCISYFLVYLARAKGSLHMTCICSLFSKISPSLQLLYSKLSVNVAIEQQGGAKNNNRTPKLSKNLSECSESITRYLWKVQKSISHAKTHSDQRCCISNCL